MGQCVSHNARKGHHSESAPDPEECFATGQRRWFSVYHRVFLEVVLVYEQEFGRAEQGLDVTSPVSHRQEWFLLIALGGGGHDTGHHTIRIHSWGVPLILHQARGFGGCSLLVAHVFLFRSFLFLFLFSFLPLFIFSQRLISEVLEGKPYLLHRRRSSKHQLVGFLYTRLRGGLRLYPASDQFGLLLDKVAVHEKQTLQRNVRGVSLLG